MEVSSRRKTSSSGYRYSRENDYEFDFNDISRASTPTSTFSSKSESRKRDKEHRYSIDDYKRKIARLKSELDLEKAKSKKAHKEKSSELREVRESYETRKQAEIDELEHKLKKKMDKERRQLEENLRNSIMEEKDKELQEVLKYKEDELRELKSKYRREKDSAIKNALENEKRVIAEKEKQMNEEMEKMKQEREKIEADYKKKCQEEARKEKEFTKIKEEYDAELRRILGESKKVALENLEKLKKAEKAMSENFGDTDDELDFSDLVADLHTIHSQASSRAVSRSVSTTSELKFDEINANINSLLASPAVTPGIPQGTGAQGLPSPLTVIKELQTEAKSRSSSAMSEPARDVFNRKQEEKDRQLQRRVSELQTQTQRLERKIALLKTENETLKRKQDDKKPLEEKVKTLKKRNAELAAIARRLEEKAKHLQQENLKKTKELSGQHGQAGPGSDQMKKMFARQRAKDLAEHAKSMLAKDREIEDLRKKCQELADQLSNSDFLGPENSEMYEEKEELVSIIKQAAKERLLIERQLAVAKPAPDTKAVAAEKYKELEDTNEILKKEIQKLERAVSDTERLEIELTQKKLECERLNKDIATEKAKSKSLQLDLTEATTQNTELTQQVTSLEERLAELDKVNEECSTLRLSLTDAQHECEVAKGEVSLLQLKVQSLETVVKNLEFSTEKLKQVETDYHEAVHKLQEKQREIDQLQKVQEGAREKYEAAIKALQEKIHALEAQCETQARKQKELTEEIIELRSQTSKKSHDNKSTEIQTGKSIEFAPSSTSSPNQSPRASPANHVPRKSPAVANSPASVKPSVTKRSSPSPSLKSHINSKIKTPTQEELIAEGSHLNQVTPKKVNGLIDQAESTKSCTDTGFADDDEVTQSNNLSPDPEKAEFEDPELFEIAKKLKELEAQSDSDDNSKTDKGEDSGMESRGDLRADREVSEMSVTESRLSALAKKGPIQVYMARYSYDPYKYSPNENPEMELQLQSGDYVLVYGEMDEDGFFDGELIDGRRGLVPSNFIEKVADEDLPDFHAAMAMVGDARQQDADSTAPNSVQIDLDFDSSEEAEKQEELTPDNGVMRQVIEPSSDLDDIEEEEEELVNSLNYKLTHSNLQTGAPFPKNLQLDRQLANSILVSWTPPDNVSPADIRSYHVFLDGDFKTAIRGSERTKALLENVESRKVHRVSVRCVTSQGQSHDNQCTILVGKDVISAPFDLRITDVTANSALVSWTPGDSNFHHEIYVNNIEVRVVKPAVFSHTLTGLSPATCHKVRIQGKNRTGVREDNHIKPEKLSVMAEFTTLAGGAPDPPVNVQVEAGPQEGSILLTWLPVTIDTSGFCNGALVTGYIVYADGVKAKEAPGPTNDHVILTCNDFQGFVPKDLLVRTITKDKMESADSEKVRLPQNLIREITVGAAKTSMPETSKKNRKSPLRGLDTEDEIDTAYKEITSQEVKSDKALKHDGKSPRSTSQSVTPGRSHSRSPVASPRSSVERKVEVQQSPKSVPQIEITQEHNDQLSKEVIQSDNEIVKTDSSESIKSSSKVTSEPHPDTHQSKYSASMDHRDGYRDDRYSSPSQRHRESPHRDISDNRKGSVSPRDRKSRSPRGNSPGSNAAKGSGQRHSRSISPSSRQSPRSKQSPRSQSSPRDGRDNYHGQQGSSSHGSPHQNLRGTSPQDNRHGKYAAKSPRTSPNSKSKSKSHGYNGNNNNDSSLHEVSDMSSVKPASDANYPESDDDSITGEINPPLDDNRIRLFVALFDYDPEVMSPNVDSLDEELPFKEGQIIKVYGDKDADGFYRGECGGRMGYIPCNMVSEIQVDDPELEEQLLKEVQENGTVGNSALSSQLPASDKYLKPIPSNGVRLSPNTVPTVSIEMPVRRMIAMYDYDPQELSPNVDAEVELSFRTGDLITTYGEMDDDGFYMGELNGRRGLVPSNFLQESGVSDEEALDSISVVTPASNRRSNSAINNNNSNMNSNNSSSNNNKPEVQAWQTPQPKWSTPNQIK